MPNFFIIGAMKAGTTALYFTLKQHPDIFMSPIKEPNFFAFEGQEKPIFVEGEEVIYTELAEYRALFDRSNGKKAIGEASHAYLYIPEATHRIRLTVPDARLICILRNPVDRAYSHYLYLLRDGYEPIDTFEHALNKEDSRIADHQQLGHYFHRGLYSQQLKRYFDDFPRDQIKVYLYEELTNNPITLAQDIFKFLGVSDAFIPEVSIKRNPSGVPKNKWLHALLVKPNPAKSFFQPLLSERLYRVATQIRDQNLVKPELSPELRTKLIARYRDDILCLQDQIGKDLSAWLQ